MTSGSQHATLTQRLRGAGCVFAEDEAALLLDAAAAGADLEALVTRRIAGEPLEHVLGWVEFMGARYAVVPGVFVPRRGSELLVELGAERIGGRDVAVDLCCGCGALGAALAAAVPGATVFASDIDAGAVAVARQNLPAERVFEGDLFDPLPVTLRGTLALIMCNAPYVPTAAIELMPPEARVHEPHRALDGGEDGLDLHRRLAAEAGSWLRPGGSVVVEAASGQASDSAQLFAAVGFATRVVHDRARTAVVATLP